MPNKLLTCQRIAREALPMLVNNLVVPELFYTDYSKDFVKEGDTLWQIGRKYYVSVDKIKEVNQLIGEDIAPGDKLLIVKSGEI